LVGLTLQLVGAILRQQFPDVIDMMLDQLRRDMVQARRRINAIELDADGRPVDRAARSAPLSESRNVTFLRSQSWQFGMH
jgi:phage terminase Nu1 subunit (DNA packaging protein)